MAEYISGVVGCKRMDQALSLHQEFTDLPFIHKIQNENYDAVRERDKLFWVSIVPKGIGRGVPYDSSDDVDRYAMKRVEIIDSIYEFLRARGDFEIAIIGWEISDQWFDPLAPESDSIMVGTVRIRQHLYPNGGLVVRHELHNQLPNHADFEPFCDGYMWSPPPNSDWLK